MGFQNLTKPTRITEIGFEGVKLTIAGPEKPKKKKKKQALVSRELSRTKEYVKQLAEVYGSYMTLVADGSYRGPTTKLSHFCLLCQGITTARAATMLKGSGCRVCRSTAEHMHNLNEHKFQLEQVSKFRLNADPVTFNTKLKHYYHCATCNAQRYMRPDEAIEAECQSCAQMKQNKQVRLSYDNRLNALYDSKVSTIGAFSMTHPIVHVCTNHEAPYSFFANATDMLHGAGCPRCKPVQMKKTEQVSIAGKTFDIRSKLESRVLRALKRKKYVMSDVLTSLEYPIPNTSSRHVPAFYLQEANTIVDAIGDVSKLKDRKKKIIRARDAMYALGYKYVIAVVVDDRVELRNADALKMDAPVKPKKEEEPKRIPKLKLKKPKRTPDQSIEKYVDEILRGSTNVETVITTLERQVKEGSAHSRKVLNRLRIRMATPTFDPPW